MTEIRLNGSDSIEAQMKQLCEWADTFLKLKYPQYEHSKTIYRLEFPEGKGYDKFLISAYLKVSRNYFSYEFELNDTAIESPISFTLFLLNELEKATYIDFDKQEKSYV